MRIALTVGDFLQRGADVYPDRIGVVDEPGTAGSLGRLTYRELQQRAWGMASALEGMGVGIGERVAIVSPNSARFLVALFGVSTFGRILVPVNYRLNADEIAYILDHSGATVLLVDPDNAAALPHGVAAHRIVLDGVEDAELFAPAARPPDLGGWEPDEDGTASINYTSGTTARPKGVQLTQRNCWLNATAFGWHVGVSDRDVYLHTLPMFHCNGWGMPYTVTAMGVPQVVIRKIDGEDILGRVERAGVTLLCGAPAVVGAILDAAGARRRRGEDVPGGGRVRMVVAGAPPPTRVIERVETELGWEFIQIYGLTETAPLLTVNRSREEWDGLEPGDRARMLARAGAPAVGVRIAVDGEGEILARTNHVFAGYWSDPESTAQALGGGWFHTGDGGHVQDAYLVVSDRKKDVIISGGENVSSVEVEDCLFQHPAVAEAAVIGVPDEKWGEVVTALVVLRPGAEATADDLTAFCRDRLAHFKCPRRIEFREALARTATGKLQKFKLREPFWAGQERLVH
jgi:acyl-CoA synthetase (AMP-forming)/AMP-acid ligase II